MLPLQNPEGEPKGISINSCTRGAVTSAVCNTFVETCKQVGVSFIRYFKAVARELARGRADYENLLPMTIGIDK